MGARRICRMLHKNLLAIQWKLNKTLFPYSSYLALCSKGALETLYKNLNAAVAIIGLSRKIHPEDRDIKVVCISFYCISFLYS